MMKKNGLHQWEPDVDCIGPENSDNQGQEKKGVNISRFAGFILTFPKHVHTNIRMAEITNE